MSYIAYTKEKFEEICKGIPANCCTLTESDERRVLDLGLNAQGGWTSVKQLLEALIGGRGIVSIARDFRGVHQFPALEIHYDDPVGAYKEIYENKGPVYGVKDGDDFVFGVGVCNNCASKGTGNIVTVGNTSLASAAWDASKALPDAIKLLLDNGIAAEDIQWAWSFAPLAVLSNDLKVTADNKAAARARRVVSIWLRGDDKKLAEIVPQYTEGTLRLHNLVTATTVMVEGPAKAVNN